MRESIISLENIASKKLNFRGIFAKTRYLGMGVPDMCPRF